MEASNFLLNAVSFPKEYIKLSPEELKQRFAGIVPDIGLKKADSETLIAIRASKPNFILYRLAGEKDVARGYIVKLKKLNGFEKGREFTWAAGGRSYFCLSYTVTVNAPQQGALTVIKQDGRVITVSVSCKQNAEEELKEFLSKTGFKDKI